MKKYQKLFQEKSWGRTLRKRKREKEIATARAIIEEYRQKNGKNILEWMEKASYTRAVMNSCGKICMGDLKQY